MEDNHQQITNVLQKQKILPYLLILSAGQLRQSAYIVMLSKGGGGLLNVDFITPGTEVTVLYGAAISVI